MATIARSVISFVIIIGTEIMLFSESYQTITNDPQRYLLLLAAILFCIGLGVYSREFFQRDLVQSRSRPKLNHSLLVLGTMVCGATLTHYLNVDLRLGPVVSSGLVTTLASLLSSGEIALVMYVASIAGMSSASVLNSYPVTIASGIVLGLVYLYSDCVFRGVGGKFGTITAGSILILLLWV